MTPDLPTLEADLALARQNGDFATEAACLLALGDIAKESEEYNLAQGLYGQAWAAYESDNNIKGQAHSLKRLGDLFLKLWETQFIEEMHVSALTIYDYALTLYRAINDIQGEAWVLKAKGDLEIDRDLPLPTQDSAITNYRSALSLFTNIADPAGEAATLFALSKLLDWLNQDIADLLQRALTLYEALQDQSGQAQTLELLAKITQEKRNYEVACAYLEEVIALYTELGLIQKQAEAWILLGHATLLRDKNRDAAIVHFDKALALSISIKDLNGVQAALHALSKFARVSRDNLAIYREIGATIHEIYSLENLARTVCHEHNFPLARDLLQQALVLDDQLYEDDSQKWSLFKTLGYVAKEEGDLVTALAYYQQALPLMQRQSNSGHHDFLEEIGDLSARLNNFEQAIGAYRACIDLLERESTSPNHKKATILGKIADLERSSKNYEAARITLEKTLEIYETSQHHKYVAAQIWWRLAELAADQNQDDKARHCFERAKEMLNEKHSVQDRIEVLWRWGRFEWSRGNLQLGCDYCRQAMTLVAHMPYNKWAKPSITYETWREEFDAMNCPTPPDSETSHDS